MKLQLYLVEQSDLYLQNAVNPSSVKNMMNKYTKKVSCEVNLLKNINQDTVSLHSRMMKICYIISVMTRKIKIEHLNRDFRNKELNNKRQQLRPLFSFLWFFFYSIYPAINLPGTTTLSPMLMVCLKSTSPKC